MTTIFLSHSSKDTEDAHRLKKWLEADERGHWVFLDDDRDKGITIGDNWEQTLYEQLRVCRVFLPIFTQNWVDSNWCFAEMTHARSSGKLILPVKLEEAFDTSGLFSDLQQTVINFDDTDTRGFQQLEKALQEEFPWNDPNRSPYPGLLAFQEDEASIYKGRAPEVTNTIEVLEGLRRRGPSAPHFVLLLGASGSGKSSLVRAGIIPRIRRQGGWLPLPPFMPRSAPVSELAEALTKAYKDVGSPQPFAEFDKLLTEAAQSSPPDGKVLLNLVSELRFNSNNKDNTPLLVIDQAEELFALERQQQTSNLLGLLRDAIEKSDGRLMVLATMRSEFLGDFQAQPFLIDTHYPKPFAYEGIPLDPLPTERFREIIREPAALTGLVIDNNLVERMVADTGNRDSLPLLAYTLRRLWDNEDYRKDGHFELREYQEIGGLEGSILQAADEALDANHRSSEELEALHGAFVPAMVGLTPEGDAVRRRTRRDELPAEANEALEPFIKNRLLITDHDAEGKETIEVAHEALLRVWPRLVKWVNTDRDNLRLLESVHRAAQEWRDGDHNSDHLIHRGDRLSELVQLVREPRFRLHKDSDEEQYLQACQQAQHELECKEKEEHERKIRDAEQLAKAQAKTTQVFKRWLAVAGLLLVVMIGATWFALDQMHQANKNFAQAEAGLLWSNLEFKKGKISQPEEDALWRLATADRAIKDAFVEQLLSSKELSERFALKPREITRALVELDTQYRQRIINTHLVSHPEEDVQYRVPLGAGLLTLELETVEGVDFLIKALNNINNFGINYNSFEFNKLKDMNEGLMTISSKLSDMQLLAVIEALINADQKFITRNRLNYERLIVIPDNLSDIQSKLIATVLVKAIQKTTNVSYLWRLSGNLKIVADKFTLIQLNTIANVLIGTIHASKNDDNEELEDLVKDFTIVVGKSMDPQTKQQLTMVLLNTIGTTTGFYQLKTLVVSLAAIPGGLTDQQTKLVFNALMLAFENYFRHTTSEFKALDESLIAFSGKLTDTQLLMVFEMILLSETKHYSTPALKAIADKLTTKQAEKVAKNLLQPTQEETDYQQKKRNLGLAAIAGKLINSQAEMVALVLLQTIQEPKNRRIFFPLGDGLVAVSSILTNTHAKVVSVKLVETIEAAPQNINLITELTRSLAAIPGNLTTNQADLVVNLLVKSMEKANLEQSWRVERSLTKFIGKLKRTQAESSTKILVSAIKKFQSSSDIRILNKGLEGVAAKFIDAQINPVAEALVEAIQETECPYQLKTKNPNQLYSLIGSLAVIPDKFTNTQAELIAPILEKAIQNANDSNQLEALFLGLTAFPGKITYIQDKVITEALVRIINKLEQSNLEEFLEILPVVASKLTDTQSKAITQILQKAIQNRRSPRDLSALVKALFAVTSNPMVSESEIALLFQVLKVPTISEYSEKALLKTLDDFLSDESADKPSLWSLVELAEIKFPALDLSNRSYAAPAMIIQAEHLAQKGDIDQALSVFSKAQKLSPNMEIAADSWNALCWNGSLQNRADDILNTCKRAVSLVPDNGSYRDSHGIARALTNDKEGAIQDFQVYLKWGKANGRSEEDLNKRREWIKQLKDNQSPFNLATLKVLQN